MRVGSRFNLECNATNDPQSPSMLNVQWFKGSTRIDNDRSSWITSSRSTNDNDKVTFIFNLFNENEVNHQHNGRYTCSVHDSMITRNFEQSTNVIVEGKQMLYVHNLIL